MHYLNLSQVNWRVFENNDRESISQGETLLVGVGWGVSGPFHISGVCRKITATAVDGGDESGILAFGKYLLQCMQKFCVIVPGPNTGNVKCHRGRR